MNNKINGDTGEKEVINLIKCPNCGKDLMLLPTSFPLFDIQCKACNFRAQIKSANKKPSSTMLGAGWDIMDKYLKAGMLSPSLIFNFKWSEKGTKQQEIRFYPFVPKKHLKSYKLSETARRANYKMFTYVDMDKVPYFVLYKK